MFNDTQDSNQLEAAAHLAYTQSQRDEIVEQIDEENKRHEESLDSLVAKLSLYDDFIAMINNEQQGQFNGIMRLAQKSIGKDNITDFVRKIFRASPEKSFSAKEITIAVRLEKQRGLLDLSSENITQSSLNTLARLTRKGELLSKGKHAKRRYRLKPT